MKKQKTNNYVEFKRPLDVRFRKSCGLLLLAASLSNGAFSNEATKNKCEPDSLIISEQTTVDSEVVFNKEQPTICIEGEGGFHVRAGGKLIFEDTTVTLINKPTIDTDAAFVKLDPGSTLQLTRVKLTSFIKSKSKETIDKKTGVVTLKTSTNIITGETTENLGIRLEISNSQFISKHVYSTGGISIKPRGRQAEPVSGWIKNTTFENTWSPISLFEAKEFELLNNKFRRNPGTNIAISGSNILVSNNDILFPGNGYVGDGITIFYSLSESKIVENNITGGSCYGIWFHHAKVEDVLVAHNRISFGITNGLQLSNDKKLEIRNLMIQENHFTGNAGFGVGIDAGVSGVTLASNYFIGNAPSFGYNDIAVSKTAIAEIRKDNISAHVIDPVWAKKRKLHRTHVNKSLNILKF